MAQQPEAPRATAEGVRLHGRCKPSIEAQLRIWSRSGSILEALEEVMGQIGKRYLLPPKSRPGDVRIYISEGETPP